jgi:hypothetical protein
MLTINEAKKLLNKNSKKYSDKQLKGVLEWLHIVAKIEVELIKKGEHESN